MDRGLARTRGGFVARLGQLFRGGAVLDEALLAQVEEVLFTADIGVRTSQQLIDGLRRELDRADRTPERAWEELQRAARAMLEGLDQGPPIRFAATPPTVLLVVGVNGTGKTTTIGKLAARLQREGRRVLLAAGDTYRAAAAEQLAIWAERAGAAIVRGKEGADPTSVIVEALQRAKAEGFDVVIADTAGRLHTKVELMEELEKVHRSIAKQAPGAPHETLLVLDATTGQNAIVQAKLFQASTAVSAIVLTKLDGTAKGGVVLGIANELKLPVRFIGIGEQVDDLRPFDAALFAEALFSPDRKAAAAPRENE
ncbi:MAG: signal recognition particle-docking protein FtsY [Proteobacteria bacterium]|nr:signal recognition particle-docking protein FtsY [Pseudomonadota bacterium]